MQLEGSATESRATDAKYIRKTFHGCEYNFWNTIERVKTLVENNDFAGSTVLVSPVAGRKISTSFSRTIAAVVAGDDGGDGGGGGGSDGGDAVAAAVAAVVAAVGKLVGTGRRTQIFRDGNSPISREVLFGERSRVGIHCTCKLHARLACVDCVRSSEISCDPQRSWPTMKITIKTGNEFDTPAHIEKVDPFVEFLVTNPEMNRRDKRPLRRDSGPIGQADAVTPDDLARRPPSSREIRTGSERGPFKSLISAAARSSLNPSITAACHREMVRVIGILTFS
uniref:Uncharacterized protein n=1 Tax=Vespula pensylvanica TaxID=30213 RepID=A0A834JPZ6_VESPE|nr:hypothetical protein H0235_017378 [Vespula pensylvanica]